MAECQDDFEEWFQRFVSSIGVRLMPFPKLDKKFFCNRCMGLAFLPYKTKCDHLFCTSCVKEMMSKGGRKCPKDNTILKEEHIEVSLPLKSEILKMRVSCPYKDQGCSELVNIRTAWDHVSECARNYATIECPWKCGKKVQLNQLNEHFVNVCHRRPKGNSETATHFAQLGCPEENSEIATHFAQMNSPPTKQATHQQRRSRSQAPVADMFKKPSLRSPSSSMQNITPRLVPNGNKTLTFTWPVLHYSKSKQMEMNGQIHHQDSDLFVHPDLAYQFKLRIYLNGTGYGKNTHISVFIIVNRGYEKSALFVPAHRLTVKILNQNKASNEIQMDIKKPLQYDVNKSSIQEDKDNTISESYGFKKFCEQSKAEHIDYLKNDTVIFEVVMELSYPHVYYHRR